MGLPPVAMLGDEWEVVLNGRVVVVHRFANWPRPGDLLTLDDYAGNLIHVRVLRVEHPRSYLGPKSKVHVEPARLTPWLQEAADGP